MNLKTIILAVPLALMIVPGCEGTPQTQLKVTYGASGIETIAYRGVALADLKQYPADAFQIGHMKMTNLAGTPKTTGGYAWGENNTGKKWNREEKTWEYLYPWGSIQVQLRQDGDTLNVNVTESNRADSGVILYGVSVVPFVLHFGQTPAGFSPGPYPAISDNYTSPGVVLADYGKGIAALVIPDAGKPLYAAFQRLPAPGSFAAVVSSTSPDQLATFQRHLDRPVLPGQKDRFTVSLRFCGDGEPLQTIAADALSSWHRRWPSTLDWKDRRAIGAVYLASSPSAGAAPDPNNPRRYFDLDTSSGVDIRTPGGLSKFQQRILDYANSVVENLRRLDAQGVVTWDIEGSSIRKTRVTCALRIRLRPSPRKWRAGYALALRPMPG